MIEKIDAEIQCATIEKKIDAEIQCVMIDEKKEDERLQLQINQYQGEIQQLNDQVSSMFVLNQVGAIVKKRRIDNDF